MERAGVLFELLTMLTEVPASQPILPTHTIGASNSRSSLSQSSKSAEILSGGPSATMSNIIQGVTGTIPASAQPRLAPAPATTVDYLHWCVNAHRAFTRLKELPMSYITDENLMPYLLSTYDAIRGVRSWLTFTSCAGVKFIKVRLVIFPQCQVHADVVFLVS